MPGSPTAAKAVISFRKLRRACESMAGPLKWAGANTSALLARSGNKRPSWIRMHDFMETASRRRAIGGVAALCLGGLMPRSLKAAAGASDPPAHPLADRLAAYAASVRFEDLDAGTVERVKTHVIDTIG